MQKKLYKNNGEKEVQNSAKQFQTVQLHGKNKELCRTKQCRRELCQTITNSAKMSLVTLKILEII